MNRILNGDFSSGVDNWENGPIDNPFVHDPAHNWIRGNSPDSVDYKIFTIQQPFALNDLAILARITAWRRYESVPGNYVDGSVKSRIKLQKPDSSWVTIAEETKTAETGSGNILDQYDILSHFSAQGNYRLMLQTESRSACDRTNHEVKVEEPYNSWNNGGFTLDGPNCFIESYPDSQAVKYAKIEKSFEIGGLCHTATATLDARGVVTSCEFPGYALFTVTLSKVGGGSWVLYSDYLSDGNWTTILNGLDIAAHFGSAGTYILTLEAWAKSGWDGITTYYPSEAWFGACNLNAQWYTYGYVTSRGFWDDLILDINVKKFKTVIEKIGCSESDTKKISIGAKESISVAESFQTKRLRLKEVKESIGVKESFYKKVYKIVKESVSCKEFYTMGRPKSVSEKISLKESFSWRKLIPKTVCEKVSVRESLTAKKTAGNIVTTYQIMDLTQWEPVAKVTTHWIKEKVIMNI